jgi:putative MFS transporter
MRRALPESPRWLASRGRIAEAEQVTSAIEKAIEAEGRTLPPPQPLAVAPRIEKGRLSELFGRFYLSRTLVAWLVCFCAGFLSHGVTQWLPSILTTVFHLPLRESLSYGVLSTTMSIAGGLGCALVIDWMGRRNWFVLSFLVCAACFLIIGWSGQPGFGLVIVLTTIGRFFSASAVTLIYLYVPELYPTRLRSTGNGTAGLWLRLGNGAAPTVVGYMLASEGINLAFITLGGIAVIGAFATARYAFETNRRVLEEISP